MNKVCVMGLGYIGLPTASILSTHGLKVIGVDVNETVVTKVRQGEPHIHEPGLKALVEAAVKSGQLEVKSRPEPADTFIIAVPTPISSDKKADLRYVEAAAKSIVPVLRRENLIVLESTCPPGTTDDLLVPILATSGLAVGEEVFVAYCPERVLPGRILKELVENDRVIGGINMKSAEKAKEFYQSFVKGQIYMTNARTAEMVKLAENTYRDVNIALANELALICEDLDIDVWTVIELANKHPRVNLHLPGPGVGGHCIPIDPWFIIEKAPEKARLIRLSREVNDAQPQHVFRLIAKMIQGIESPKVAILGVAYKADIDDARESPARELIRILLANNYTVAVHDPYVKNFDYEMVSLNEAFEGADCVVIMTDHDIYRKLNPNTLGPLMRTRNLLDTRNAEDHGAWRRAGFRVMLLGCGEVE